MLSCVLQLILEHLKSEGVKDAGPLMRGKVDEDGHSHSKAAFRMLEQFLIGSVKAASGYVTMIAARSSLILTEMFGVSLIVQMPLSIIQIDFIRSLLYMT